MLKTGKNILLTGGTGFIGKTLTNRLLVDGNKIYILTRQEKLLASNKEIGNKHYISNLSEINDIHIDVIINLAGETIAKRWTNNSKESIYNSRIITTQNLIKYISAKTKRPELFISASAVGYYGTHPNKLFHEDSIVENDSGFASNLCTSWEQEALSAKALGVRTVILRIGPVFEKDGGMIAKLLPSFYLGLGSQIGDGKQYLSWIDRDDLINLMLYIMEETKIEGAINAVSPNPVTNKQFSLALANALNRPCFLRVPGFIFRLIFGQMAEEIMLNGQNVSAEKILKLGFKFAYPNIAESMKKIFNS